MRSISRPAARHILHCAAWRDVGSGRIRVLVVSVCRTTRTRGSIGNGIDSGPLASRILGGGDSLGALILQGWVCGPVICSSATRRVENAFAPRQTAAVASAAGTGVTVAEDHHDVLS